MAGTFRETELARLDVSGWKRTPHIRDLVEAAGLPQPDAWLRDTWSDEAWDRAESALQGLREHFARARFAGETEFGLLLVPPTALLDTRGSLPAAVRAGQHPSLGEDFLDPALGDGADVTTTPRGWGVFATVVGPRGLSLGSHDDVVSAPGADFEVSGHDTRVAMTRQLWGARLLQSPPGVVPDSDLHDTWTFTLFPGERLVDGQAVSGTVLKGKVRFRLGKRDRGIGSARVSPAIPVGD